LIHVALYEPEIPQNTGNIARTCAATGMPLHIVGQPIFSLDESRVRRAGLDYWPYLSLHRHADLDAFAQTLEPTARICCLTTKATLLYTDWEFRPGDCIMFGPESRGLPPEVRERYAESCLKIPMFQPNVRSLNLANSVAVVLYEAIRQLNLGK
jgi:tRNA (cytidine/uridine-2'-O-)-methyltransferase